MTQHIPRLSNRWLPELDTLGLYLSGKKELQQQYKMMFNPKGDGFPAAYDTPERQEEYKQFYLQCSITFSRKTIKTKQKCRQFLRKEMQPSKKRLFSVSKLPKQQNTETGRKTIYYRSLSANSMSHYPPMTK